MPKSKKSHVAGRDRRASKASDETFTSDDARSHPHVYNAEQIGVPTALASWIGQRLASLFRRMRRKEQGVNRPDG